MKQNTKSQLYQIYFYLTEGCNLSCRHCWINPKRQSSDHSYNTLDMRLFKKIIDEAKELGIKRVKLTGGEPLLHPFFTDIIRKIYEENILLSIETNGTLCSKKIVNHISKCKNSFVSVSIDSADAATHDLIRGRNGAYEQAIKGAKNLVNAGINTQIIMTVMKINKNQMEDVAFLSEKIGANSLKYNIVQPTERGEFLHNTNDTLDIYELINLGNWVNTTLSKKIKIRVTYSYPPAFRTLSSMLGEKNEGCGTCGIKGIIGVLNDGSYALCGIGTSVAKLVFGNASKDLLADIWQKNKILIELRQGLPKKLKGICGNCMMKGLCLGSCIAQNYYSSKDLWAPFWFCEEAYKNNIFPKNRLINVDE